MIPIDLELECQVKILEVLPDGSNIETDDDSYSMKINQNKKKGRWVSILKNSDSLISDMGSHPFDLANDADDPSDHELYKTSEPFVSDQDTLITDLKDMIPMSS